MLNPIMSSFKGYTLGKTSEFGSEHMKLDFKVILFTDECRETLDGLDGWSRGWVANGSNRPIRVRRQQGAGNIKFSAGIIGNELVGSNYGGHIHM